MLTAMTTYISHIQIANALLCLLLAMQFLTMRALRPLPKRWLGLNYFLYAHQSIALVAILSGHGQVFSTLRPLVALLLGPAMFVYFSSVHRQHNTASPIDLIHFGLGILIYIGLITIKPLRGLIDIVIPASFGLYFLLIALRAYRARAPLAHLGDYAASARRWLSSLMLMAFISTVLEIAVTFELRGGVALRDSLSLLVASALFLTLNIATMLASLYRSDWLEWMYQFGEQTLARPPDEVDEQAVTALFQRWEALVRAENLHKLEFGITLAQAAKKLQVSARQLSIATNHVYGKSFSVYLNDQRIAEAQRLLQAAPDMAIIDVMQESGFSSKSNFNKEFLRVTGVSPSAFRQACISGNAPA